MTTQEYPIGTPGQPWGQAEKDEWLAQQSVKRSYFDDVVRQIDALREDFEVTQYGTLPYAEQAGQTYPLYVVSSGPMDPAKPCILVTGGVHGYETSGVHGALAFIQRLGARYSEEFNWVVAPCVSPWGYETINRWNVFAVDPNRAFKADSESPEASQLMDYLQGQGYDFLAHIDLHETTDTDNSEFRPALAARDGRSNHNWNIPDGFYLVANSELPQADFQRAVIEQVATVTHIAEADEQGQLIGAKTVQPGVIEYPAKSLGLCMGLSSAAFVTTTEVYPDSAKATPEQCVDAQVAAVQGALDFLR